MLEQLIIVAGPSCSGKTHFVKRLRAGDYDELLRQHSLVDPKSWVFADVFFLDDADVQALVDPSNAKVLAHWTIPHPSVKLFFRDMLNFGALDLKHRLQLIAQAQSTISLTLHAEPKTLLSRIDLREQRVHELYELGRDSFWKYRRKLRHLNLLRRIYSSKSRTQKMYGRWFRLLDNMGVEDQLMVAYDHHPAIQERSKWTVDSA